MDSDKVLDLDIGSDDVLYRVLRNDHVVYVHVTPLSVIPDDKQTYGPHTIQELAQHAPWSRPWTTLIIDGHGEHLTYTMDSQKPHRLDVEDFYSRYEKRNFLELGSSTKLKQRVSEVYLDGTPMVLKIARFGFEVGWMSHEARIYDKLQDSNIAPRLVALVYEGTPDRIVGILLEKIEGVAASSSDFDACARSLEQLHKIARHGDLNRWNIIVTPDGPKFIDFEDSELRPTDDSPEFDERLANERVKLEDALKDDSGAGRPHHIA